MVDDGDAGEGEELTAEKLRKRRLRLAMGADRAIHDHTYLFLFLYHSLFSETPAALYRTVIVIVWTRRSRTRWRRTNPNRCIRWSG